ncbi:MAG TPA: hypothetical protein VFE39_13610 [Pseudonocardia sp.]|jgi:MHS family shikimate/dehydroshikimate transporter-like MFS transporter|nr:hypothetical protein [Pseudonocardia sp.]
MWIRLTVSESPVFRKALGAKSAARMPVLDALRAYPKEIALASGSFLISLSCSYLMTETRGRGLSAEEPVRAHS